MSPAMSPVMSPVMSPFARGGDSRDVKTMARPFRGTGFASHTKTLKMRVSRNFQLSPLPKIGEGFGEWSEAPSYEEGVGVDGDTAGLPSERGCRVSPCKEGYDERTGVHSSVMELLAIGGPGTLSPSP